jgi:hypothetical protein
MPTAEERLAQITPKLDRAKEHYGQLTREIQEFLATVPYKTELKRDPVTRRVVTYLSSVAETPPHLALVAGDVVQNLVSALDHLAYQLVLLGSDDKPRYPKKVYFPISADLAEYDEKKTRYLGEARPAAVAAIDELRPYKGGNDTLWALHNLNIIDKHRLLITVGSNCRSVNVGPLLMASMQPMLTGLGRGPLPKMDLFLRPADTQFPLKAGDELFGDLPDAEARGVPVVFQVALSEPGYLEAASLLDTLSGFTTAVDVVIQALTSHLA